MHIFVAYIITALVAGCLGYGLRGAIGRELKIAAADAERWATQLETGLATQVRGVANEIRAKLSKL